MSTESTISGPMNPVARFFQRFHTTIFIVFILGCLLIAVLLLYQILNTASVDPNYKSDITAGYIDQATLDRINALHSSNGPFPEPPAATTRLNPFGE
jgi:hypothetical protein